MTLSQVVPPHSSAANDTLVRLASNDNLREDLLGQGELSKERKNAEASFPLKGTRAYLAQARPETIRQRRGGFAPIAHPPENILVEFGGKTPNPFRFFDWS